MRRSEQSRGRVQPPIDHHNTVARWPEAILVQERVFAERVELSCCGSYGLWGSNLSHVHSTIISDSRSLPVRGNGGALNIRRRDPARAARRARRGGRDQHALPTRHRPYRVGRNDGRDRAKRTTVLSAAERNYAPKLTRAQKRVPPACKRCWQATVHLSMSRTFRVAELPGGAPRLSDFADVCWPRWPQIGLSGLFSACTRRARIRAALVVARLRIGGAAAAHPDVASLHGPAFSAVGSYRHALIVA